MYRHNVKPVIMAILITLPTLALAADPKEATQTPWWAVLVSQLIQWFVVFVIPILSYLAYTFLQSKGMEVDRKKMDDLTMKAAQWAEEQARKKLKADGVKTSGAEKMRLALEFVDGMIGQYKLDEKAVKGVERLIEANLKKAKDRKDDPPKQSSTMEA